MTEGYWTIKAQEYNDNDDEIDEINNRCLTYIPSLDGYVWNNQEQKLERVRLDNYLKRTKVKGYV